jgi:hypothetical protein
MPVEFILNGDTISEPVTADLIARSINSLDGDGDSFAILARDSQVYIQTSGDICNGFILEYRNGSESEHYVCTNPHLSADKVIKAMQRYLENDSRWKTDIDWQPQSFDYQHGGRAKWIVAGLVIALVAAGLAWQFFKTA